MRVIKIIIILLQQLLRLRITSASACELETWSGQQGGLNAWRTEAKVQKCCIFCFQNSTRENQWLHALNVTSRIQLFPTFLFFSAHQRLDGADQV